MFPGNRTHNRLHNRRNALPLSHTGAHGLLYVVGAMCSPVYCLTPPFLLSHYCFSYATSVLLVTLLVCLPIYSPGVISPVLFGCLMSDVTSCECYLCLPACFSPSGWLLLIFCLILLLKDPHSPALESSPHLSSRNITEPNRE